MANICNWISDVYTYFMTNKGDFISFLGVLSSFSVSLVAILISLRSVKTIVKIESDLSYSTIENTDQMNIMPKIEILNRSSYPIYVRDVAFNYQVPSNYQELKEISNQFKYLHNNGAFKYIKDKDENILRYKLLSSLFLKKVFLQDIKDFKSYIKIDQYDSYSFTYYRNIAEEKTVYKTNKYKKEFNSIVVKLTNGKKIKAPRFVVKDFCTNFQKYKIDIDLDSNK